MQCVFSEGKVRDRVGVAIDRIRLFEPYDGYYVAYSGGKDSIVIADLMEQANVKYRLYYNHTTIDPPELVRFIRQDHRVHINMPRYTMWELIRKKGFPPTRQIRYCCSELKEKGGNGRFVVTGVRWAESPRRKHSRNIVEYDRYGSQSQKAIQDRETFAYSDNETRRQMIEHCHTKGKHILNPIIDWSDNDVWEYIHIRQLPYCSLYDEGFQRLGCIGCPLTGKSQREMEFGRWPTYRRAYIRVFDDIVMDGHHNGLYMDHLDGIEAFEFYLENGYLHAKDRGD